MTPDMLWPLLMVTLSAVLPDSAPPAGAHHPLPGTLTTPSLPRPTRDCVLYPLVFIFKLLYSSSEPALLLDSTLP